MLKKGFTIIELLIVVAIISILATMMFVSYSGAQAKSRDAKRMSDLNELGKVIQRYYVENNNVFPSVAASSYRLCVPAATTGDWYMANCLGELTSYTPAIPKDPRPNTVADNSPAEGNYAYGSVFSSGGTDSGAIGLRAVMEQDATNSQTFELGNAAAGNPCQGAANDTAGVKAYCIKILP